MPFLAECIMCRQKVRVPDRGAGSSVQCPRCGSYFTAAAENDLYPTAKAATAVQTAPPAPSVGHAVAVAVPAQSTPADASPPIARASMPAVARPAPQDADTPSPFDGPIRQRFHRPDIDPIGATALLVSGVALFCASAWPFAWFTALVMPLAIVGALFGLAGALVGCTLPKPRYRLASAAAVLCVALLAVAIVFPSLLGPNYRASRDRAAPEPVAPHAVPLPGKAAPTGTVDPEWVDAGKFALQFKNIRVQVVSATVRPLEIASQPKKKFTKEKYLVIRVRAHQPGGSVDFTSKEWSAPGSANERPAPTLTDSAGKTYAAPTQNIGGEATELTQKSDIFPLGITDEIYLFEAPRLDVESFRLEIPAATFGGAGVLRFTISSAMFRNDLETSGTKKAP